MDLAAVLSGGYGREQADRHEHDGLYCPPGDFYIDPVRPGKDRVAVDRDRGADLVVVRM